MFRTLWLSALGASVAYTKKAFTYVSHALCHCLLDSGPANLKPHISQYAVDIITKREGARRDFNASQAPGRGVRIIGILAVKFGELAKQARRAVGFVRSCYFVR